MDNAEHLIHSGAFERAIKNAADATRTRAYPTPRVNPEDLSLTNRLSLRRPPIAVTLGDAVLAFAPIGLDRLDRLAPPDARILFWFTIDGRPLVLQMATELYERIVARIDPELLAADIDRDILPLLLESCVEDALNAAESELGHRIELVAVQPGAAFNLKGMDVALEVSIDGKKAGMAAFRAAKDDVLALAELFAARPRAPRSYGDLKAGLSLRAGAIWLDLGALKTLKTGDVLLANEDKSRFERLAAVAGEHWLLPLEMTRKGLTAQGPFRRADLNDQEEWMMADHSQADNGKDTLKDVLKDKQPAEKGSADEPLEDAASELSDEDLMPGAGAPPADAAFDDLPIKLVFEIGKLELPLGELQEIGKGHVFELQRPLGEAVEIHAAGRRIGQGEVVRIEDQIGVRVVRLFGQGGA